MKFKVDKHPAQYDEATIRYTTGRILEMRGQKMWSDSIIDEEIHPYIRRRLDEIKRERGEK
jgi:hypothetical protein